MDAETERVYGFLSGMAAGHSTLETKQVRALLSHTGGWLFCNGHMRDICSKHLGVGVHKVWTERQP